MAQIRIAATMATVALSLCATAAGSAAAAPKESQQAERTTAAPKAPKPPRKLDRSGRKQVGKASFYARKFTGRKMADGKPMDPRDDNAASKTLPLGTTARVTNLETGQSARVTIQDRGPYVRGRIIDLSPKTAQDIGLTREQGLAPVEVAPITLPPPDAGEKIADAK